MITEKQAEYLLKKHGRDLPDNRTLVGFNGLLNIIEEYELAKMFRFDANNRSTWPKSGQRVLAYVSWPTDDEFRVYDVVFQAYENEPGFYCFDDSEIDVDFWSVLPSFPSKQPPGLA